jgi:hypothetical protein
MSYRTIKSKVESEMKRATHPKCQCGQRLNPKTAFHYINEFGEFVPICAKCAKVIRDAIDYEMEFYIF